MTAMGIALSSHLQQFVSHLKDAGIAVDGSRLIDCCRAVALVGVSHRGDFKCAIRATLIGDHSDYPLFHQVFERYWGSRTSPAWVVELEHLAENATAPSDDSLSQELIERLGIENPESEESGSYSQLDIVRKKDLATLSPQELLMAQRELAVLARRLGRAPNRRRVAARKGREIDFRKWMRVRQGYPLNPVIPYRRRDRTKSRLFVLCDISGSMERYSRFFLHLLYAMEQSFQRVSVALFATRVEDISHEFRQNDPDAFLQRLSEDVTAWSGGTKIGSSIEDFLALHADKMNAATAVTLVISDGWDTGENEVLQRAMVALRRRSRKILWLNPLLGDPRYQPLCLGMATALPFVDAFLPAHNLDSLSAAIKKIAILL